MGVGAGDGFVDNDHLDIKNNVEGFNPINLNAVKSNAG